MTAVTFTAVNEAIRRERGKERLVQTGGVFAFTDGSSSQWAYRTVHAKSLDAHTVEEWVAHWERLQAVQRAA